jgi:hypothetical protein
LKSFFMYVSYFSESGFSNFLVCAAGVQANQRRETNRRGRRRVWH